MSKAALYRLGALALVGAGVCTALFWLLVIPFETFAGPEIPLHPSFSPAQTLHILGSVLSIFGFTALYLHLRKSAGTLGLVAYAVAVLGALGVFADGVLGLIVFPELARHAPEMTSATGPMFTGRVLGFYIGFFAINMVGMILLGIVLIRSAFGPRAAAVMLIIGAILSNLPPSPTLHLLLVAGGVLLGIALGWLGYALRGASTASP